MKRYIILYLALFLLICAGCRKLVSIPEPINLLTTAQVFSNNYQAQSAISGIYAAMLGASTTLYFGNGGITVYSGLSADELSVYGQYNLDLVQFNTDQIQATNGTLLTNEWSNGYSIIYAANAAIEALTASTGVTDSVRNELQGEAEFVRAYCYFYMVNLFGPVPLALSTNWKTTGDLPRAAVSEVYAQIEADLKDAKSRIRNDYAVGNGERIIPTKSAANALLARLFLYNKDWSNAIVFADSVIVNSVYTLTPDLNSVFLTNSSEAIWQLKQDNATFSYNATVEGYRFLATNSPYVYLTKQLLDSFEVGDQRRVNWIDSISYNGGVFYYPYKYKIGAAQSVPNGSYTEYYMVLRLAEQFLIRAEAKANSGDVTGAVLDLDVIRERAGLPDYLGGQDQVSILNAIYHEREIELFCEWGHRWLDLKRIGRAGNVLGMIKPGWTNNAELYPIPQSELRTDPSLSQNPGY